MVGDPLQSDLQGLLDFPEKPLAQLDHFKAGHLETLFRSKIARSQATGKDGMRIGRFEEILRSEALLIETKVAAGTYHFTTFKERLILRGADRAPRQISIPTVRDRLLLRAICQILHSHNGQTIGSTPHALVSGVTKAIREGDQSSKSFVRIDVKDFFPSISHSILRRELESFGFVDVVQSLCMQAVATPTGVKADLAVKGVPQGLSVSGALAALYMLRFDNIRKKSKIQYFRYVDDILLICDTKDSDNILDSVGRALKSRGLVIHKKGVAGKTEITRVDDGVDFLGYRISVELISVRESSYKKMFKNILKVITDFRYRKNMEKLIFRLNLKITGCIVDAKRRGWMMFFSHSENMNQLAHLDAFIARQLTRVAFPFSEMIQIKRFIKSYHEIRYSIAETKYIPNFDNFEYKEKVEAVAALSGKSLAEVLAMDINTMENQFSRLISKEVHDLEQDVGSPS